MNSTMEMGFENAVILVDTKATTTEQKPNNERLEGVRV
jgi:hypothetical protein